MSGWLWRPGAGRRMLCAAAAATVLIAAGLAELNDRVPLDADVPVVLASPPDAAQLWADRSSQLTSALTRYAATVPPFSVAVLDQSSGWQFAFRAQAAYDTASVVKVQLLACLLLRAQDRGRWLTGGEQALAQRMIRVSDNAAASGLFASLGRAHGVQACGDRLGLVHTRVDPAWGRTRTTVADQVELLAELEAASSPLNSGSRAYARALMASVDPSQRWGVPVAAGPGDACMVKNGWDTRVADGGRWVVNSVGLLAGPRGDVSVAVLSHGHTSMGAGIAVVETAARMTRRYLRFG